MAVPSHAPALHHWLESAGAQVAASRSGEERLRYLTLLAGSLCLGEGSGSRM